jgi:mannosyltransferase
MTLPRGMRYLAAATLCIFVYLFVQILHAPQAELRLPASGSNKPAGFQQGQRDHDPLLDRTMPPPCR